GNTLLDITGDFTNTGTIEMSISGTSPGITYDQIRVGGTLELGGTLEVSFSNGYSPSPLSIYDLFSHNGDINGYIQTLVQVPSNSFALRYDIENVVRLDFDDCGDNPNIFNLANGDWEDPFSWSSGRVPKYCDKVLIAGAPGFIRTANVTGTDAQCHSIQMTNAVLNIQQGAELTVSPNFEIPGGIGTRGIELMNGRLNNNGTINIENVAESRGVEVFDTSVFENHGQLNIKRIEGTGLRGMQIRGTFINEANVNISQLEEQPFLVGILNFGNTENNGIINTEGYFSNNKDTSVYKGDGRIVCDSLNNYGLLQAGNSPGIMEVVGDLNLKNTSVIEIEAAGSGGPGEIDGHDLIDVTGKLTLDGTVDIISLNNFQPDVYDRFTIFKFYGSLSNNFSNENYDNEFNGFQISDFKPNELNLVSIPECSYEGVTWEGIGSDKWNDPNNWEESFLPQGCHEVFINNTPNKPRILSGVNAKAKKVNINLSTLTINPGGSLVVDGLGSSVDLFSLTKSTVQNDGNIIIRNSSKVKGKALLVGPLATFINNDKLIIEEMTGSLGSGITNLQTFTNNGALSIFNMDGTAIVNEGGTFDATKFGSIAVSNCESALINYLGANFFLASSFNCLSPMDKYAFFNDNALIRVFSTGRFTGLSNAGSGGANTNNASIQNFGIIE
ncbi:MAG: hypothetical protein AAGK97_03885, partial [Bacteroidota bacterium]